MQRIGSTHGIVLAAVILTALGTLTASAAERLADGAVTIRAAGATSDGVGSGTIVAREGTTIRILTAKHVATFGSLSVRFEGGTRVPARIVVTIPDRDLAVVEADVPAALASTLHPAQIAEPRASDRIHVWGSGLDGPSFEEGAVPPIGANLPDGAARGRFAISCALCHEGDSGGGVFDPRGRLVGVYIGYFGEDAERISIAESPFEAARLARALPFPTTVARTTR